MSTSWTSPSMNRLSLNTIHDRGAHLDSTPPSSPTPKSAGREERTSFSSVREDGGGTPQTFFDTRSSLPSDVRPDHAQSYGHDSDATTTTAPAWKSQTAGHGPDGDLDCLKRVGGSRFCSGTEDFKIPPGGLSYDLKVESCVDELPPAKKTTTGVYAPGESPMERLPLEVLEPILRSLMTDLPTNGAAHRNVDLVSCLLTSRRLALVSRMVLHRHITIPHSLIFAKFLSQLESDPSLRRMVRRLDFSHFSSVGLGRTRRMNCEIQRVTADTLARCLDLTPHLQEFLAQEHLDGDLDYTVLRKLLCDMPQLRALDFCACSSNTFRGAWSHAMSATVYPTLPAIMPIKRLSLHECGTLPAATLERFLSRLGRLTHLDLGHTSVTPAALARLPDSARLSHLNLSKCTRLIGDAVVAWITTHPSARDSLVYLNLHADPTRYRLLNANNVSTLLARLPPTIRALNLNGAQIVSEHVSLLRPLVRCLDELGLAYAELSMDDLQSLYLPLLAPIPPPLSSCAINLIKHPPEAPPALYYLDLTGIPAVTASALLARSCIFLRPDTKPLEVLELGTKAITDLRQRTSAKSKLGWVVRECGRRAWLVRQHQRLPMFSSDPDPSRCAWKMGALWWGMRKVPVARSDVGGLYGHYMFKR